MRRAIGPALAGILALAAMASAPRAHAQQPPPPVDVRVEGIFGNDALIGDGYATVVITLRNTTRETFRGRVRLVAREHGQAEERHVTALDLPGGETRRVLTTLFLGGSASLEARYEVDGGTLGLAGASTTYAPGGRSIVLLSDPPRLRATLLDLTVSVPDPSAASRYGATAVGGERAVDVPLGIVALDPATADPILPEEALGWSSVGVVIASTAMLARVPRRELDALVDWVRAGGHLVIAPRSEADLRAPLVRELVGDVATTSAVLVPSELVPGTAPIPALACGEDAAPEPFGCAATVGFGLAYVLAFDITAPPSFDTPQARELSRSIAQRALRSEGPRLAYGRGRDQFSLEWWSGAVTFARLRAALDPNEGYRPALGLVAIVLFLYVLVVGPLNFRFVLGRNTPTLALVTTPIAAFACVLVMLFVGYLGKGVLTRYRRVEIVEAIEGSSAATARSYTGLFLTRPSVVEVDAPERGLTTRLAGSGGSDDGLIVDHGAARPRLTNLRAALWETLFLRTDRVVALGGEPVFRYESNHLVAVTNGTTHTLRGAVVVDESQVYEIGDVEPGATRPIPRAPSAQLSTLAYFDDASDPVPGQMTGHLGLDAEDDTPYVRGVLRLIAQPTGTEPLLWATLDPDEPPATSPGFARDRDLRILLMHPRRSYDPLGIAPPELPDGSVPEPPIETELPAATPLPVVAPNAPSEESAP